MHVEISKVGRARAVKLRRKGLVKFYGDPGFFGLQNSGRVPIKLDFLYSRKNL